MDFEFAEGHSYLTDINEVLTISIVNISVNESLSDDPNAKFYYSWDQIMYWSDIFAYSDDFTIAELQLLFNWSNVTMNAIDDIIGDGALNTSLADFEISANLLNDDDYYVFVATVTYCAYDECTSTSV